MGKVNVYLDGLISYIETDEIRDFLSANSYRELALRVAARPTFAAECISLLNEIDFNTVLPFFKYYRNFEEVSLEDKEDMQDYLIYRAKFLNSKKAISFLNKFGQK